MRRRRWWGWRGWRRGRGRSAGCSCASCEIARILVSVIGRAVLQVDRTILAKDGPFEKDLQTVDRERVCFRAACEAATLLGGRISHIWVRIVWRAILVVPGFACVDTCVPISDFSVNNVCCRHGAAYFISPPWTQRPVSTSVSGHGFPVHWLGFKMGCPVSLQVSRWSSMVKEP